MNMCDDTSALFGLDVICLPYIAYLVHRIALNNIDM